MEDHILKKNKQQSQELVKPIFPLAQLEKENLKPNKYTNYICHYNPRASTSGKYVIKTPRFDPDMHTEWIILVD